MSTFLGFLNKDDALSNVNLNRLLVRPKAPNVVSTTALSQTPIIPDISATESSRSTSVTTDGNQMIHGNKSFAGNILLATNGGMSSLLNYYEESTFQLSFIGPCLASGVETLNVNIVRIGKLVVMTVSGFSTTGSGVPSTISTAAMLGRFAPTINGSPVTISGAVATGTNNGMPVNVVVSVAPDSITLSNGTNGTNFTGIGPLTLNPFSMSWTVV